MSRSYKRVRPKKNRVYMVPDVMKLFSVSQNTVTNWVKHGLRPSDAQKPYVFRGAELIRFHEDRKARTQRNLRPGEFKCLSCKAAVFPERSTVPKVCLTAGSRKLEAVCPDCEANLFKFPKRDDLAYFSGHADPNTTLDPSHEEKGSVQGGIGISWEIESKNGLGSTNDRVIYEWQKHAGKWHDKTIEARLSAIRRFEEFIGPKPFAQLSKDDVAMVRDRLKDQTTSEGKCRREKATVSHIASDMKMFLDWLLKQDGYKRLPKDLPGYMDLPKAFHSEPIAKDDKPYLKIEDAKVCMLEMPNHTLLEQRDRAMFSISFLGALRADTITSLLIRHVDFVSKKITQDAAVSRTKNGKSLVIKMFPIPREFYEVVEQWVKKLEEMGFGPNDALFPSEDWLGGNKRPGSEPCLPMTSTHAVASAFRSASIYSDDNYSPHSAKHTIGALGRSKRLTRVEWKAWSENMGHNNPQTTETYYGKMSDEERFEVLEGCDNGEKEVGFTSEEISNLRQANTLMNKVFTKKN